MRKEKALVTFLRDFVDLVADEAARNHEFSDRIEQLLIISREKRKAESKKTSSKGSETTLLDVHSEWSARGESEFRIWLKDQPIPKIRAVIRAQDFDPTRKTVKWKDADKLAGFVVDNLRSRLSRGSAFIGKTYMAKPAE